MIVLDTNVLSETLKPSPSPEVQRWFVAQPLLSLYTTAITQGELLYGVELLQKGRRRSVLESTIKEILKDGFEGRVLPFDAEAAEAYAGIAASRRALGRPISDADARIAAIVCSNVATLATRNARDFAHCGIKVFNPWA